MISVLVRLLLQVWRWLLDYPDLMANGGRGLLPGGAVLLAASLASIVGYQLIGSSVDEDGTLHEPFALIPLAWIFGLAGGVLVATAGLRRLRANVSGRARR